MDQLSGRSAPGKSNNKALRFVLGMGLLVLVAVAICALIWWFFSDHDYDLLGQYIIIAGIIFLIFGVLVVASRGLPGGMRRSSKPLRLQNGMEVDKRGKQTGTTRQDTRLLLFFCGTGLLCLFIGNLIVLGL